MMDLPSRFSYTVRRNGLAGSNNVELCVDETQCRQGGEESCLERDHFEDSGAE